MKSKKWMLLVLAALLLIPASCRRAERTPGTSDAGKDTAVTDTAMTQSGESPMPGGESDTKSGGESAENTTGGDAEKEIEMEELTLKFENDAVTATGLDGGRKDGTLTSYACWQSTGFVDISGYAALKYELAGHRYLYSLSFYNEQKKFISGVSTDSIIGYTILQGHVPVPEGAKYARFADFTGSGEYPNVPDEHPVFGFCDSESYVLYKKTLKHDGLKIVCLGDSLTEGDHGLAPGVGNKHYLCYPYYLAKIMGCTVVNDGRCGYSVSDYASLYGGGSVNVRDADVVLIMLGTNGGITVGGSRKGLTAYRNLVEKVRHDAPEGCKVVLLTPPHATEDPKRSNYGYAPWVINAAEEVRAYAASARLPLIDVYADSPIQADREDDYQPVDGLHCSAAGYEALAEFIAAKLENILAENP